MKARFATGLAFAWSLAACLAQGDFYLSSPPNHRVTINAPANWYSGTFSAEVWELNAYSIPPNLNTVAPLSPIAAYSLLAQDGFQLEQTFVSQTCNNGYFSLGEMVMGGAWGDSTVVIVLAAWNTAAPSWNAMLAEADSNTRAGVIAWTQLTGDVFDTLPLSYGTGAWNQDLVLMPVVWSPTSPPAGMQAQDFTYNTNNGAITIMGYTGPGGSVAIPSAIQGLPVVSISSYAFYSRPGLTNVSIPAGVTNIGNLAFYACIGLTAITVETLNSSYASINGVLFDKPLTTLIQCPGGKTGNYAIPDGVTNIADNAFAVCPSLLTVTMPDSLASIGDWAFFDCTSLTSVAIPDKVTTLGSEAFLGCASLTNVTISDSVIGIGPWTFGYCASLTNATIGNAVSNVGTGAFQGCLNLTRLTIPSGVTNIGDLAFADCTDLTSISISSSVASIGDSAFTNCTSLAAITVDASNLVYSSLEGVLFDKSQTTLIAYPQGRGGDFTIPEGVTNIQDYAFYGCASVNSITIPGSVSGIGSETFWGCASLTNVMIGNGVGSIGEGAFYACANLPGIAMPNSVTSIGDNAFASCSSLTNFIIPNSVTNVGGGAFSGCSRLGSIIIGEGVISIGSSAFIQSGLTSVIIPDSVVSIGSAAFRQCGSLTNVLMGHGVTNIADYTFFACTGLIQITIPDGVTSIGQYAFNNCQSLTDVALPDSLIT
jgi:hypothetical protein